jgi:Flp pilus assembly protein TadB
MSGLAALAAGGAVFLLATRSPRRDLGRRLAVYLLATPRPAPPAEKMGSDAGVGIGRRAAAAITGAVIGALLGASAAGGPPVRAVGGMALAGAGAGFLAVGVAATQRREARRRSLRQELPTVADALALHVLAGESIPSAVERFCRSASGVAAAELAAALTRHRQGAGLPESLTRAARATAHPDAARLYETLAHAHQTGGRLADGLAALAADFRAAIGREIVAEGGRRALATYGPILALQIPVTLLFLMYPTLVGLGRLSATP